MNKYAPLITSAFIALLVSMTAIGLYHFDQQQDPQLRSHYYRSDVATLESPHGVRMDITRGEQDFILVDVRSQQEYILEHIIGALNVPAYKDPQTSAYDEVDRISQSFMEIRREYPDREIIVYCYSASCMSGRKIGNMLSDYGIFVKGLGIGWNEWRYYWNTWKYPSEWETTHVKDYIYSGTEPGVYRGYDSFTGGCSLSEDFGC
jgi:rhodanese-related sulfurtransferase